MKKILILLLLLTANFCNAQVKLEQKDLNNLIAIGILYSNNTKADGKSFAKSIDSLRTPTLNHIADALIATGKGDKTILETQFLVRPNHDELVLWYVIREIHYNRTGDTKTSRPDSAVAKEVLTKNIDERWLLDNYYNRIFGGITYLFNEADLSKYNFDMESLGLKNETEKAIFFLNMMEALVGPRFKILNMMKKNKMILEYCDKLPKFNGKKYYYYTNFDYDDFDWIGYDSTESYNGRHIGGLYNTLIEQMNVTIEFKGKKTAQEIYYNSILHEPKYFKFSASEETLQTLYGQLK